MMDTLNEFLSAPRLPATLITETPEDTERVGEALACAFTPEASLPPFVALYGALGVGKTAFVRGFARILAPGRAVRSPTFALVNEYRAPGKCPLFHFDMYRIESEDDLYSIGYDDYLERGLCLVEWCEHIPFALPARRVQVIIEKTDDMAPQRRVIRLCLAED